jgi:diaminohydroxyphosphoribosylaminopyrimidine deaminase / 5-amino-6-(5-phosphoribosylamino)uracil reductase
VARKPTRTPPRGRAASAVTPRSGTRTVPSSRQRAVSAAAKVAQGLAEKQLAAVAQKQMTVAMQKQRDARAEQDLIDEQHMRRALELAEQFRGRTAPNPIVGCVIVDAVGNVIAEGVHRGPGTKHAEIDALDQLGGTAPGATLYVNLEPCTHQGRTPPCAPVVAAARLARVVVGSQDPIPAHAGGLALLQRAGMTVSRALVDECDSANLPFRTWALHRRAAYTLKAAITLDGKIATVARESKWITSDAAREHGHRLRSTHDAILVGVNTVLADDPQLTARIPGGRDPVRIVVDSGLRTPSSAKLLPGKGKGPRTIIATTLDVDPRAEKALVARGAEVWRFPAARRANGQPCVPLDALATRLADENLLSVLVEGGAEVHASLLADGLAADVQLFIAPKIVGGPAPGWVGGEGVAALTSAYQLTFVGEPRRIGDDLLVRAVVVRAS